MVAFIWLVEGDSRRNLLAFAGHKLSRPNSWVANSPGQPPKGHTSLRGALDKLVAALRHGLAVPEARGLLLQRPDAEGGRPGFARLARAVRLGQTRSEVRRRSQCLCFKDWATMANASCLTSDSEKPTMSACCGAHGQKPRDSEISGRP